MESPSPYEPPRSETVAMLPPMPFRHRGQAPVEMKVFGILNLIFGGLGTLGLFMMLMKVFGNGLSGAAPFLSQAGPAGIDDTIAFHRYISLVTLPIITDLSARLVLSWLIVHSGLLLCRSRPRGVILALRYAKWSLAAKCLQIILTATIVIPALKGFREDTRGPDGVNMMERHWGVLLNWLPLAIIACCSLYPLLVWWFLRRPHVLDYARMPRATRGRISSR